jgi:hypothetical protein
MYSEYRTFVVSVWFYGIYLTFSNLLANSGEQTLLWDEIQGKYNDQSGENPALSRCLKTLTILFGFPIFRFWAYLMKVIPETRLRTKFDIYVFISLLSSSINLQDINLLTYFRYVYMIRDCSTTYPNQFWVVSGRVQSSVLSTMTQEVVQPHLINSPLLISVEEVMEEATWFKWKF